MIFSQRFDGTSNDTARGLAVDAQGSIFLAGAGDSISFGGPSLMGGYIVKFASNGSHLWSKAIGPSEPAALALDAGGGVAVTGQGQNAGALNFGGEDLPPVGTGDLFLARLDGSGNHVWSRRFGSSGVNLSGGTDVSMDSEGNLAVTGSVYGNVPIDNVILTGDSNAYITQFDADGNLSWSRTLSTNETCFVAFSPLNELAAGGSSSVAIDLGEGLMTPVGDSDLFILKIAP